MRILLGLNKGRELEKCGSARKSSYILSGIAVKTGMEWTFCVLPVLFDWYMTLV